MSMYNAKSDSNKHLEISFYVYICSYISQNEVARATVYSFKYKEGKVEMHTYNVYLLL